MLLICLVCMQTIKNIKRIYIDPETAWEASELRFFCQMAQACPESFLQFDDGSNSLTDSDSECDQAPVLVYQRGQHKSYLSAVPIATGRAGRRPWRPVDVTDDLLEGVTERVKQAVSAAATAVVDDLQLKFEEGQHLSGIFSMLQLPFWHQLAGEQKLEVQQAVDKAIDAAEAKYGEARSVLGNNGSFIVPPLLDGSKMRAQRDAYINLMQAMASAYAPGSVTTAELWMQLCSELGSGDGLRNSFITEFVQLFKISLVFPIGSVDNERRFSLMNLIHDSLRNRMQADHLNTCVRIASSSDTYKTFDIQAAHRLWLQGGIRGRYKASR
jgi:hypothetical protein